MPEAFLVAQQATLAAWGRPGSDPLALSGARSPAPLVQNDRPHGFTPANETFEGPRPVCSAKAAEGPQSKNPDSAVFARAHGAAQHASARHGHCQEHTGWGRAALRDRWHRASVGMASP